IASLHSTQTVAAIGVANGFINPIFLFGIGLMMGVSPLLAIKIGKGQNPRSYLKSIIVCSFLFGLALSALMALVNESLVEMIGIEEALVEPVKLYISIVAWSFPFAMAFQAAKEYLQAFEEVVVPNLLSLGAVALNIGLNYVLVFGLFSYEGLGEVGLALASLSIRILLCFVLLGYLFTRNKNWGAVSFGFIREIVKFGSPVAFMFFLEVLAFCAVSVLSGKINIVAAATNNIIMTLASITFMIPLSISSAVAVKVGNAYGSKSFDGIDQSAKAALFISIMFTVFSASAFYFFPAAIMSLASSDSTVVELGVRLLFVVALFQIVDGLQVVLAGILRGLERAVQTSAMVFVGYWMLGIPLGVYLAFQKGIGVMGLWIGLASSLAILALSLGSYCLVIRRKLMRNF
ncbi:MAG: MATE family efflux transporter, partial [Bacteriovoracaceae bacterium]